MISVEVEKEIKQENRVIGKFTFRQALCFVLVALIVGIAYLIIKPSDPTDMIPPCMVLGLAAWYFGFHKKSGLYMEYFLGKRAKDYILRNGNRKYRSKNAYYKMLNDAYNKDKADDLADKKKAKYIKKQEKKSRKKKTKLKGFR